jgi:hypothetical protein
MATPMTAAQFVKALKDEGLTVLEHSGWESHNRAASGRPWGPVHGVMIHHTGGTAPSDLSIVWSGRSDLPGPCAHSYLSTTGVVTMTANGRANHAGGGDPAVLSQVENESYGDAPSAPKYHEGSSGAADGNVYFYGLEVSNTGSKTDDYPAVQYQAIVKWAAAICRFHGWSVKSVIGHKEWSNWKPDPIYSMVQFRKDVKALLAKDPTKPTTPTTPPVGTKPTYEPYPGAKFFSDGKKSPIIEAMHNRLVAVGCDKYQSSSHKDTWGSGDKASYAAWQRKEGYSGTAADGIPGQQTWNALKVPNV